MDNHLELLESTLEEYRKHIRDAYGCLRTYNNSIPDEVLRFIIDAAEGALKTTMRRAIVLEHIKRRGQFRQMEQAIEECNELGVAISHLRRGRAKPYEVAKEIADVENMCLQMREIIGDEMVDRCLDNVFAELKAGKDRD